MTFVMSLRATRIYGVQNEYLVIRSIRTRLRETATRQKEAATMATQYQMTQAQLDDYSEHRKACDVANRWNDLERKIRRSKSETSIRTYQRQQQRVAVEATGLRHVVSKNAEGFLDVTPCELCDQRRAGFRREARQMQFESDFDSATTNYLYRLQEMKRIVDRELAHVEANNVDEISASAWRNTVMTDLPALAAQIEVMVKARKAFTGELSR